VFTEISPPQINPAAGFSISLVQCVRRAGTLSLVFNLTRSTPLVAGQWAQLVGTIQQGFRPSVPSMFTIPFIGAVGMIDQAGQIFLRHLPMEWNGQSESAMASYVFAQN
jgi:hypothetical protein